MIEETATVVSCENNQAMLEVQRQSTCGSCNAKSGCGTAVFAKTLGKKVSQVSVNNTLNLQVGDKVIVGLQESALLTGSAIVYLLPLISMLLSAALGQWLANHLSDEPSEILAVSFAIAGFAAAMKLISHFSKQTKNNERFQLVLIRKLIN